MNNDIKKVLNDVDTAFEVVRVSWDNPTPQAVAAMNEAWTKVRALLQPDATLQSDATLTDERRQDMLVGALEGGSNYWYEFRKEACKMIEHCSSDANTFVDNLWRALKAGYNIPVHDIEGGRKRLGYLTYQNIIEGEKLMREKHPEHWADIINGNDDAITADVWFQMVVLQELVYG